LGIARKKDGRNNERLMGKKRRHDQGKAKDGMERVQWGKRRNMTLPTMKRMC